MELKLTKSAIKILEERYLNRRPDGTQETPKQLFGRVATAIAKADRDYGSDDNAVAETANEFYHIMADGKFLPNSPTLMNAGLDSGMQLSACYVLPVDDSIEGVFKTVGNAALVHKTGGGTGFAFSHLRPRGNRVASSGGVASGPVSFMRVFDGATEAIKQGGRRRGANMGILRVDHPDIEDFITCKLDGGITNFNISVAITKAFMQALEGGTDYDLIAQPGWPTPDGWQYKGGEVIGTKSARTVFALIRDTAWASGDPGLVFIDRVNDSPANPIPDLKTVEACNPCGEQFLFPNDACNLGSIDLAKFVKRRVGIDWPSLSDTVKTAIHFLDNVIAINPYPLPEIDRVVKNNRRVGLGIMGWADMLFMMGIAYNSDEALALADKIMGSIKKSARQKTCRLAEIRGPFPNWNHSRYKKMDPTISPMRNGTLTAIAPTGSISIIAGTSSGIEPAFALAYRHVVKQPEGSERVLTFVNPIFERMAKVDGFWSEALENKILKHGSVRGLDEVPAHIQDIFVTAHEITPAWHVKMQAAFQKHTDNGVSKTINLPAGATRQDVENAYLLAYETGCLGITVFRDGCKGTQVLNVGAERTPEGPSLDTPAAKVRPIMLSGATYRKKTPVGTAYITINSSGDEPFEVFVTVGKAGSDVAADAEGIGRLCSLILRSSGELDAKDIIGQLRGVGSGRPQGFGKQRVMSLSDAIAQALAEHIGIEGDSSLPGLPDAEDNGLSSTAQGDLCPECGHATFVFEEGCKKCYGCGYSEC